MTPSHAFPGWLAAALESLARKDVEGWLENLAVDAVHEFPGVPEGQLRRLNGHDAMRRYMSWLASRLEVGHFDDVRAYEAGDDTIVQATGHHKLASGGTRKIHYIWFITRRNNLITRLQTTLRSRSRTCAAYRLPRVRLPSP